MTLQFKSENHGNVVAHPKELNLYSKWDQVSTRGENWGTSIFPQATEKVVWGNTSLVVHPCTISTLSIFKMARKACTKWHSRIVVISRFHVILLQNLFSFLFDLVFPFIFSLILYYWMVIDFPLFSEFQIVLKQLVW